jgi:ABC-type nitrate/sulfonate/bicarbonate transport system substrate-binding protein
MLTRRRFCHSLASTVAGAACAAGLGGAGAGSLLLSRLCRAATATANRVAMQAAWVNDAEFIGYFVGLQNGYYKAQDVDMQYLSGGPDVIPESALLAGKAPLALTAPDTTLKAISAQGAKFKIIGAQFQKTPIGVVSLASNPVATPKALEGKVLAVPPVNMAEVAGMLRLNGIAKSAVRIVPYQFDPTPLIKGEIDASVDFVTDVPYTVGLSGKKAVSFLMYDYGVTLYADTVAVTEEFLAANKPLLVRWLRASRQGWNENFKDPAKYPRLFKDSYFSGTGRTTDNDIYTNTADKALIDSPQGIFCMSEEGIAANIRYLKSIGIAADRSMFDTTLLEQV